MIYQLDTYVNYYQSLQPTTRTVPFFFAFSDLLSHLASLWSTSLHVWFLGLKNLSHDSHFAKSEDVRSGFLQGKRQSLLTWVCICMYICIIYIYWIHIYIYSKHTPSTWVQVLHCEVAVGKNASHISIMSQNIKSVSKLPSFIKTSMVLPKKIGGFHLSPRIFTNS